MSQNQNQKKSKITLVEAEEEEEKEQNNDTEPRLGSYEFNNLSNPDETIEAVSQLRQFYEFELNLLIYLAGNLF